MLDPSALAGLASYVQIVLINVVLSGDNIVVIAMAAAGLAPALRMRAILVGIVAATVIRIAFSLIALELLAITGLLLAGGLLLLWVCWKMFMELWQPAEGEPGCEDSAHPAPRRPKSFAQSVGQIVLADVSMSLDNVLAVAGAAQQNITALIFGLILSIALMAFAANKIAALLARYRWIGWIGLAIITYVAGDMIYEGALDLLEP